jgi:hypothetical protein
VTDREAVVSESSVICLLLANRYGYGACREYLMNAVWRF